MQNKANLQDIFLLRARRDAIPVTMFLMNGFQMRGVITGYDAFVVILDSDGKQQVIYKHAISTIAPIRPVNLAEVKLRSRQYAKRQLTWLRRNPDIHWIWWEKDRDFVRALQISTEILTAAGVS